ncbi:MAG: protein-methionine-sulfoxide reductase catalytic subunit MsrP [Betaproteobacteria bacterium]|nr:protein-methionine-sulfoxide reductase catalytic subunit MsrP [Betaproteobacteria bacterium]
MLVKKGDSRIKPSEITSRQAYCSRREIIAGMAGLVAAPFAQGATTSPAPLAGAPWPGSLADEHTPKRKAITYNNFYELGNKKEEPAENKHFYDSKPWKVKIGGLVEKPGEYDVDELIGWGDMQERVYRLRCVEAWSMVIPWFGFPLNSLIDRVQPSGDAKYVAFQTFHPLKLFPDEINTSLPWPYVEGLRMDEARHDLTLLTFGMYGEELLNQNGAPLRIIVPWKYGYKSIKALVAIDFVAEQPPTSWNKQAPHEYGFYSNVNPERDHPRWSQKEERAIGSGFFADKRTTDMFNGYEEEVASLYQGMDLIENH